MAGINHVTGEWWWTPGTRGLKRGCPMKDGKIDIENKNKMGQAPHYDGPNLIII